MRKDANTKAQTQQYEIDNDIPFLVRIGKKTFRVPYLKDWVGNRISYEIAKKNGVLVSDGDDITKVIASIKSTGDLSAKVVSLAILGSWLKIKLFHWIFWRYITVSFTKKEINSALTEITDRLQLDFFFLNMILIEGMNQMRMKLTKMEAEQYRRELQSELRPTS